MKVTVTKYLNVRVGRPSLEAPCYQYLAPGSELEVDGKHYTGDKYDGNDQWFKDAADNYYWSGGVEKPLIDHSSDASWGLKMMRIDLIRKKYACTGKNIKVAVLDSGIVKNHMLRNVVFKDFVSNSADLKDEDTQRHGSRCAELIASNEYGCAPDCKLFVARTMKDKFFPSESNLIQAIYWAINEQVNIISISQAFLNNSTDLENAINAALAKDIIVLAAVGNASGEVEYYPASLKGVVTIGAINQSRKKIEKSGSSPHLNFLAPGYELPTSLLVGKNTFSGTSAATAFTAGLLALVLENNKNNLSSEELKTLVYDNCDKLSFSNFSNEEGCGLINLEKTLKKL